MKTGTLLQWIGLVILLVAMFKPGRDLILVSVGVVFFGLGVFAFD